MAGVRRFCSQQEIVNPPKCPDESVQDVRGRGDNILLEPETATRIHVRDPALVDADQEASERHCRRLQIFPLTAVGMGTEQERDSLTLR